MSLSGMKLKYMILFPFTLYCQWSTNTSVIFLKISGGQVQIVLWKPSQGRLHSILSKRAFKHYSTLQTQTAWETWRHHMPWSATHLHTNFYASAPGFLLLPLLNPGGEVQVISILGLQTLRWIPDRAVEAVNVHHHYSSTTSHHIHK